MKKIGDCGDLARILFEEKFAGKNLNNQSPENRIEIRDIVAKISYLFDVVGKGSREIKSDLIVKILN